MYIGRSSVSKCSSGCVPMYIVYIVLYGSLFHHFFKLVSGSFKSREISLSSWLDSDSSSSFEVGLSLALTSESRRFLFLRNAMIGFLGNIFSR